MRKEIVIVILVGIGIGILVAFGVYTARKAIKENKTKPPAEVVETAPVPAESPEQTTQSLSISEPENNSLVDQDEITVAGVTSPNSVVTIIAEENEYLLTADASGKFSTAVSLVGGANDLAITAFDSEGKKAETVLTIVYSTAKL
ncbi:MAG: hypothetical protein A2900_04615 [Candidatus Chisholmbacteria bacterium RIFCSPLOWO2_01_FULL_50_28]|uniref:Bacterial Ig domain-containing protein n=1 Tax=Candidatus Chisholmbacteria bacterium RIFCSPHIGHO2_01_FULL_52_32 TaxID=1797591 RepID=A0A1G1VSC8_9BACT|nr:MAG: hypothetical protein A2786_02130 [Candidatus Chisholmbacteria bacterium RIFCSPHIGHO2_01_FULL_52_32]OGY20331.1 MAG: hypothetical protein A2900_04615 [Candidatus Chisholmbacteria bacterium RIFCSPLOWO2_01_FULL_50_28]